MRSNLVGKWTNDYQAVKTNGIDMECQETNLHSLTNKEHQAKHMFSYASYMTI